MSLTVCPEIPDLEFKASHGLPVVHMSALSALPPPYFEFKKITRGISRTTYDFGKMRVI